MTLLPGKFGTFVKKEAKLPQKIGALLGVLAALALMLVLVSPALAADFTVTNTNDSGDGSLRQAILDANANPGADTIVFDAGFVGVITLTSGQLQTVTDDLTIEGPGAASLTISGNNTSRVLEVAPGVTLNLEGVTVANGNAEFGGGIRSNGTLNITGSVLFGNSAGFGGGINNFEGTLAVTDSFFLGNSATNGGGIWNSGMATVTGSTISGNSADTGGGINHDGGTLTVTNAILFENSANDSGGGIFNSNDGNLNVTGSDLSRNSANEGGGIYNLGGTTVSGSTLAGNSAEGTIAVGGGIYNFGILYVNNSTLSENGAGVAGGILTATFLEVTNSTFSGNSANNGGGILNDPRIIDDTIGAGVATVTDSTFSGNVALSGGGISSKGGGLADATVITNSTLSENVALGGGGVFNDGGTTTVTNSTLAGNGAAAGGGIRNAQGTATLHNTVVANSPEVGNCSGVISDDGGNLSWPDDGTCPGIHADPLLGPLQDNGGLTQTMALAAGSPAIDAALAPWPDADQRGVARPQGTAADIGAFELVEDTAPPVVTYTGPTGLIGDNSPTVTGTATDNVGVTGAHLNLNGGPDISCTVDPAGGTEVSISCPTTDLPDGDYTAMISATDAAGNVGTVSGSFRVVFAAFQDKWNELGGAPGPPTSEIYQIPGGLAQNYTVGRLIYNDATGKVYWLYGPILAKYDEVGAYNSQLGLPIADVFEYKPYGQTYWARGTFKGGWIYWTPSMGAKVYYK